jgi:chromosomal replication initiation ATPase DnaA
MAEIESHMRALRAEVSVLSCNPVPVYKGEPTGEQIVGCVCRQWGINAEYIFKRSNSPCYLVPRRAAMYLLRKHTSLTLHGIARMFGQHHTTVMHGISRFEKQMKSNIHIAARVELLEQALRVNNSNPN